MSSSWLRRGHTLAEVLILMALLSLVLGAVALLTRDLFRTRELLGRQSLRATAVQVALQSVRADLESAIALVSPSGAASSHLILTQVDNDRNRYPHPLFPTGVTTFDPLPPHALKTVSYRVLGEELVREVSRPNGNTSMATLLEQVSGFSVVSSSLGNVSVQLRLSESPQAIEGEVFCPCLP